MVKGDIVRYVHTDDRVFFGVIRDAPRRGMHGKYFIPLELLLQNRAWNRVFVAAEFRVTVLEAA